MDKNNDNEKNTVLSVIASVPVWMIIGAMIGWRIGDYQGSTYGLIFGFLAGKIFCKWVQDKEVTADNTQDNADE